MRTIFLIMIGLSSMLSANFTRDINGTVMDSNTGLQWQDDVIGSMVTWAEAIDGCESLSLGGHEDWRLPNLNELISLVDDTRVNPSISPIFQSTESFYYWSSTSSSNNSFSVWRVIFHSGTTDEYGQKYLLISYVRCVRNGQ